MRKSIVTTIAVLTALVFGLSAYAHRGFENCGNMPCCANCYGYDKGFGPANGGRGWSNQAKPITQDEAKAKVEAIVKENFKGYTVTGIKSLETFRGMAYVADVKDSSGNVFSFFIGCNGMVRGPIHNGNFYQ